jgi:hypothetical protein
MAAPAGAVLQTASPRSSHADPDRNRSKLVVAAIATLLWDHWALVLEIRGVRLLEVLRIPGAFMKPLMTGLSFSRCLRSALLHLTLAFSPNSVCDCVAPSRLSRSTMV